MGWKYDEAVPVTSESLREEATRASGLDDWGDATFFPTLDLLLDSCRATARLTPPGWDLLQKVAVRHLRNQLYLQAFVRGRPEVGAAVTSPVLITGLPRTGTTLLHNLLALDPANRVLRFWEGLHPVPVEDEADAAVLVGQAEKWLDRLYELTPAFRSIHFSTAQGPEECDALLQNSFASQHFDDMFQAETYSAWLNEADLVPEYAYYARQLQVLNSAGTSQQWVLKSPSHLGYMHTVCRTFPGARIVQCHRDPVEAIGSYASLVEAVRSPHQETPSPSDMGAHALRRCAVATARMMRVREQPDGGQFFDVGYKRLTHDPMAVVSDLYEWLGRPLTAEARSAMLGWLSDNPQHKQGVHAYSLDRFGLSHECVVDALGPYIQRFRDEIS